MLESALAFLARGWSVFPVIDKRPLFPWAELQKALPPEDSVRMWWTEKASAGIAKFKAWFRCSRPTSTSVVTPTRLPRASNKPPPEEPGEMGAVVCT